jgi:transposase
MKNYIGIDAHSKTCTFVVMDKEGEILREGKINTTERNLKDLVKSIEGTKAVMFEETNIAQWIYCVLKDEVDKLIVCHPAHLPKKSGPKNDYRDALHLVMQLRAGNYTSVYHEQSDLMNLRAVINHYNGATVRLSKLKFGFKAILRSEGIPGESAFKTSRNKLKIDEIKNPHKKLVAQRIFDEMNELEKKKDTWVEEFRANKFNLPEIKNLGSIPGVGPVRAHEIAAYMCTGHRFENKHKLWSYAKLIRHRDESDGYILRRRTPHGRSELKNAFMGTAQRVIISPANTALKDYYNFLMEKKGLDKRQANKALARKIAAICLVVMKKGTKYDDKLVRKTFED